MSNVVLCQVKMAEHPYYIETISRNIYSIEELCYYLSNNIYLIDASIIHEKLYQWIQEELELPSLAGKLRIVHGKAAGIEEFLYPILKEINYLNYEETKALSAQLQQYNRESAIMREKRKADCLVENGIYAKAIQLYRELLEKNLKGLRKGFEGAIWYNLGCTYSYLFQKENAVECFEKAYWLLRTGDALKSYLLMYKEAYSNREYEKKIKELRVDAKTSQEIQQIRRDFMKKNIQSVAEEEMDGMLKNLTREYHRNAGA